MNTDLQVSIPDSPGGPCVVCALTETYRKHESGGPFG